ncbi:MAG: two-component sensor histidine kinase [Acidobacteriia bacterium]|nr:two-component sensor histidine kinase [Terriglobia bacterium]
MQFLRNLLSPGPFMPHGFCYLWNWKLVWLHVISDTLVALAYISIPLTLTYFIRKRKDVPFNWMFLCFGIFIVACGATHVMEVVTLWIPAYWLSGGIKALTALASVPTAILLVHLMPQALALPRPEELRRANEALQAEIQERKQAEGKVRRQSALMEAANQELEAFCYSVSHDLRAPLRSIDGFSQALLEDYGDKLDAGGQNHLLRVRGATQRMGTLIDDLLNLSRVTRFEIRRERVDLSALARSVAAELLKTYPGRSVEFHAAAGLEAEADPHLLRIVLDNLLSNAWKFTSKHPAARIEFGKLRNEKESIFFVKDDGAGFDSAYAQRLFGVFQRLHSASEFPGTGVGLATVQRIIHRLGGRVWAEGAVEKGATFYFTV